MPGFLSPSAVLHGVETRTSSPVRVDRGEDCASPSHGNLYPCGEGAGYAGGIVSAAADGVAVADAVLRRVGVEEGVGGWVDLGSSKVREEY